MPSTYTQNINIEKPGTGEQAGTWGVTANNNYDTIDVAIDGFVNVPLPAAQTTPSAPFSLTTTQGQNPQDKPAGLYKTVSFSGTQSAAGYIQIDPSTAQRLYFVRNQSSDSAGTTAGYPLVFQQVQTGQTPTGATFSLDAGQDAILYADGAGNPGNVRGALDNPQFNNVLIKGSLTVTGSQAQTSVSLNTTNVVDSTRIRRILYTTSGKTRWEIQATTGPSEIDPNNPASDLKVLAYADDASGNPQIIANGSVLYINRASGNVVIGPGANIPGSTSVGRLGDARLSVLASTQSGAADQTTLNVVGRAGQTSAVFLVETFDPGTSAYTNLFAVDSAGNLRVKNDLQMWKNGSAQTGWSGTITGPGLTMTFVGGVLVSA